MLLHVPHRQTDQEALLVVGQWWSRWTRTRTMLAAITVMHMLGAFTLAFAPRGQLVNVGTRPVFDLFPPHVWAVLFLLGGLSSASLLHRFTAPRQALAGFLTVGTQAVWAYAADLAVIQGDGSAMAVVFLPMIVAVTVLTIVFVSLDLASGKR
jgi:tryptophan-rich sensory protein